MINLTRRTFIAGLAGALVTLKMGISPDLVWAGEPEPRTWQYEWVKVCESEFGSDMWVTRDAMEQRYRQCGKDQALLEWQARLDEHNKWMLEIRETEPV